MWEGQLGRSRQDVREEPLPGARGQAHSPLSHSRDHECSELGLCGEPPSAVGRGLGRGSWKVGERQDGKGERKASTGPERRLGVVLIGVADTHSAPTVSGVSQHMALRLPDYAGWKALSSPPVYRYGNEGSESQKIYPNFHSREAARPHQRPAVT